MTLLKENIMLSFGNSKKRAGFLIMISLVWFHIGLRAQEAHILLSVSSSHPQQQCDCTMLKELKYPGSFFSIPSRNWK